MSDIDKAYRQLYEHHYPPMNLLSELGGPVPRAFHSAAELIININLHRTVNSDIIDPEAVRSLIETAGKWQLVIDDESIGYDLKINLEKMMAALSADPNDLDRLQILGEAVAMARRLPFPVDLWKVQNIYWGMLATVYPEFKSKTSQGDPAAKTWVDAFAALGKDLSLRVS
jgi:hypothetical protein